MRREARWRDRCRRIENGRGDAEGEQDGVEADLCLERLRGHWAALAAHLDLADQRGQAAAQRDADRATQNRDHNRFDQELGQDVEAPRADSLTDADFRGFVQSTLTSMMFMMPMPPTTSEMPAMAPSSIKVPAI